MRSQADFVEKLDQTLRKKAGELRNKEEELLAFETAHPGIVGADEFGQDKHDANHPNAHGHNKGAKHEASLEDQYGRLKRAVIEADAWCNFLRGVNADYLSEEEDFEAQIRKLIAQENERTGNDLQIDFE